MRRRLTASLLATCVLGIAAPSYADSGTLGGFTGSASATPLRIEVHEQAIPVPADPQLELNLLYTKVTGDSGPTSTALGSALWPGDAVGQGLPAIGAQLGLPSQLTAAGYPLQANAASPAGPPTATQQPLPGLVTTVSANDKGATAVAGLGAPATPETPTSSPTAGASSSAPGLLPGLPDLSGLLGGLDLGSLTGTLGNLGAAGASPSSSAAPAAPGLSSLPNVPNPLGALSALVSVGAATSTSTTTFATDSLTNKGTSRLADVNILGGLIHLDSIVVSATSKATLDGAKDTPKVDYAGLTLLGQPLSLTSDGFALTKGSSLPGLGLDPSHLLGMLGISLKLAPATDHVEGSNGTLEVRGPELTIDTTTLRSKLPTLPLSGLLSQLPASAEQLVSLLLAVNEAHPKVVLALGDATASTAAVAPLVMPVLGADSPASVTSPQQTGPSGTPAGAPAPGSVAAPGAAAVPTVGDVPTTIDTAASNAAVQPVAAAPGLPPLGSLPGLLLYGGLALAGAVGWWVRRAGVLMLGGGATCAHGLRRGLPDLRKVSR